MLAKSLTAAAKAVEPIYVEDVFSTWLYTGNGSTQTITNGIDLSGKGGLVWVKERNSTGFHNLVDTVRGASYTIYSNDTSIQYNVPAGLSSFNSNGFSVGNDGDWNENGRLMASWTFREAAKFFDVVTWTAGSSTNRRISHSLGSAPGLILIKNYSGPTADNWYVYHRSLGRSAWIMLNQTSASSARTNAWGTSDPTSSDFGIDETFLTQPGETHVAYLFAHDAGGFGDAGTDSVVSCGTFTTDGSGNATATLGWEPQFTLSKRTDSTTGGDWWMFDSMRGMTVGSAEARLLANTSGVETTSTDYMSPTASGFTWTGAASATYIYIAIRRGPMKTPTDATKVFNATTSAASTGTAITTNFPIDLQVVDSQIYGGGAYWSDRLRGVSTQNVNETKPYLYSYATDAEQTTTQYTRDWSNTGFDIPSYTSGGSTAYWSFRRAPGFFDVVAYTGTASTNQQVTHNLTVAPELIIVKHRTTTAVWLVYLSSLGRNKYLSLNTTNAVNTYSNSWGTVDPTATTFNINTNDLYATGNTIAYLFASCPGVSKVGSYTGTGTTLNIDCGFTNGARFVLIKRTDSTGDWYVWDTARGIVSGNDPYLLMNSTAAEVTNTDYIDPLNAGFQISSTAPAAINANGGSFIYLAVA